MATSRPALSSNSVTPTPKIITDYQKDALQLAIQDRVSKRAFSLFEASGREDGNAEHHWFQAEAEILRPGLEVRESGSWLSVNAFLPDVGPEDMEIYVQPDRVVVHAQKSQSTEEQKSSMQTVTQADVFLARSLPVEVDPPTASAAFKDQKLTLMVKKRYPEPAKTAATRATD
jgi:HSP20 family molecular chaperone IbpA